MKALQIGAGNIGRGFIGQLLSEAGYDLCFADINDDLIEKLQEKKAYQVELAGAEKQVVEVTGVEAVHSIHQKEQLLEQMAQASLITTAVGPNVLKGIAPSLAEGLKKRMKESTGALNIIACENMAGATDQLKSYIFEHLTDDEKDQVECAVGFANAAVDRIVPEQPEANELAVTVEPFFEWAVETPALKGERPNISAITFVEDLTPYIERKLFTVNTGHAALAYHGFAAGNSTIKEAIENPDVYEQYAQTLEETSTLLQRKHGFQAGDMKNYRSKITERFQNPYISDSVKRVGRGPIRKLGPNDRLVKPALELLEQQENPKALAETIAACLEFQYEEDEEAVELQRTIEEHGKEYALTTYTGLSGDHPLIKKVLSL